MAIFLILLSWVILTGALFIWVINTSNSDVDEVGPLAFLALSFIVGFSLLVSHLFNLGVIKIT